MRATIEGEDENYMKIYVTDNLGSEHELTIEKDSGDIPYHQCEAYASKPRNRTPEENEHNEQARKFAQYYVYLERGYDTVPPKLHPERLNIVRAALAGLSEREFEGLFGDLYRQLQSHQDDTERVIDIPTDAASADSVLYRKHIYLGVDPLEMEFRAETRELAARYGLDLSDQSLTDVALADRSSDELTDWMAFSQHLSGLVLDEDVDLSEGLYIDAVPPLHICYLDADGEEHITDPGTRITDGSDAMIEIPPMEPDSLDAFQDYLNHNLACQIRDSFVRMGLEPPEQFHVLGYGRFEAAEQYRRLDMFPNYIDPEPKHAFV